MNEDNIEGVLEKSLNKILEWASYLCGLIYDQECEASLLDFSNEEFAKDYFDLFSNLQRHEGGAGHQRPSKSFAQQNIVIENCRSENLNQMLLAEVHC